MTDTEPPFQRRRAPAYALVYAHALPHLQNVAREHGYALATHGSMATDFDLLACPWTDEAESAEALIEALRDAVNGYINYKSERCFNPEPKPHGRLAWAIYPDEEHAVAHDGPYIDVSVMPRLIDPAIT